MTKWTFNFNLFTRLSDVLGISESEIARRCDMKQATLNRYTSGQISLPVSILIEICNHLRMPTYFFITENDFQFIPTREEAIIPKDCWQPVTWNKQIVEVLFGDGPGRIYWRDVARAMGTSAGKPHSRFLMQTRFPVVDFLLACTNLHLSPYKFLIDLNRKNLKNKRTQLPEDPQSDIEQLRIEIASLRADLAQSRHDIEALGEKYTALLQAHKDLARMVNINIHNFNDSHLSIAAEPSAFPYGKKDKQ